MCDARQKSNDQIAAYMKARYETNQTIRDFGFPAKWPTENYNLKHTNMFHVLPRPQMEGG